MLQSYDVLQLSQLCKDLRRFVRSKVVRNRSQWQRAEYASNISLLQLVVVLEALEEADDISVAERDRA